MTSNKRTIYDRTWRDIQNKGKIASHNLDAIYGYIRLNYASESFPVDIIKLIIFFYQDGINWKLNQNEIVLLTTSRNGDDKILSNPYAINDIIFHFVIYPCFTEHSYESSGDVSFGLEMTSLPPNIEYMKVYFELNCVETSNCFRATRTFGTHQASGSVISFVKTADIRANKYKTLTFQGCLDMLCLKYKQNIKNYRLNTDPRFMDLSKMDRISCYEWMIKKEVIESKCKLMASIHSMDWRVYSPSNFNHNAFGLCLCNCEEINGLQVRSYDHLLLAIRNFRTPAKVKQVDVRYKCEIVRGHDSKIYKRRRIMKCGSEQRFKLCKLDQKMKDTLVKVEIEIEAVFDYSDQKINEDMWKTYGIL